MRPAVAGWAYRGDTQRRRNTHTETENEAMNEATKTKPLALTYPERLLKDGGIESGLVIGIAGSDTQALRAARRIHRDYRRKHGYTGARSNVLTAPASQPKTGKNDLPTYTLMLTPERGLPEEFRPGHRALNLCPSATPACAAGCLSAAGRGRFDKVQHARATLTGFMFAHPHSFGIELGRSIAKALSIESGAIALRLNCLTDIRWELIMPTGMRSLQAHGVTLYDYTAFNPRLRGSLPGYHLTFSAKEPERTDDGYLGALLASGRNVAMPFNTGKHRALPETWNGFPVIDGDLSDYRPDDPSGVVVGLRWKDSGDGSKAAAVASGFCRVAA